MSAENKYMDWLKGEVGRLCNERGCYEVFWDYSDSISPDDVLVAWDRYKNEGFSSPEAALETMLYEDDGVVSGTEFYLMQAIERDVLDASEEVQETFEASENRWDDLEQAGYNGVDLAIGDLLDRSEFKVNLILGTEEERNLDFSAIDSAYCYRENGDEIADVDADTLDNALSYLVNQQGHSVKEVYAGLEGSGPASPFVDSVVGEIEDGSFGMSALTALATLKGEEVFRLLEARDEGTGSIELSKDACVGIFEPWAGAGSTLGIELERDMCVPAGLVSGVQIEGMRKWQPKIDEQGRTREPACYVSPEGIDRNWTVNDVYGLVNEAWSGSLSVSAEPAPEPACKEDYGRALEEVCRCVEAGTVDELCGGQNASLAEQAQAIKAVATKKDEPQLKSPNVDIDL